MEAWPSGLHRLWSIRKKMKRYLSLYFQFWRNCSMRDLEFRFNAVVWTVMNFIWFGLILVSLELIFGQVEMIAGWTKDEVLLLAFIQLLFSDFLWTFILVNLGNFSELIRRGNFDFVLLKPVSPRFLVSARYFESDHYVRILVILLLIPKHLDKLGIQSTASSWMTFGLLFVLGIFIFYNLFFIFTTTNFWFINLFNLNDLFDQVVDLGRYPVHIFKGGARLFFVYLMPVAFIATFPAQALLGQIGFEMVFVAILISLITFSVSQWFWQYALRHYQSASS